LAAGKVEDSD
uniref:Gastric juice peptide 1 n=1 Tax=Homo sapiens TaxID=9606 RepID=GAJU_HUMAN|nr:RecName: Full=Gastric juice peptide 1; Contains: RecName: Full=Gastric juice peptide 2 [Homo sapiens]